MNSNELKLAQIKFQKLSGRIEMDETFIKEIHKGNFKNKDDIRRQYINAESKDELSCIVTAIDQFGNIYVKATKTKRLQKEFCEQKLMSNLIKSNSTLIIDMQTLYQLVASQTNSQLISFKSSTNKQLIKP